MRPAVGRLRRKTVRVLLMVAALPLFGASCELPNNLLVNLVSQGASTATNGFVSAVVGAFTGQLFGVTGTAPVNGGEAGEAGDGHDDGDEH